MKVIVSERAMNSKADEIFVIDPSHAEQVIEQLKDDSRQGRHYRSFGVLRMILIVTPPVVKMYDNGLVLWEGTGRDD